MSYFLQDIAEKILGNSEYQSDKTTIVFPNRRAGLFLTNYLKQCNKTLFMPCILGMDDFVSQTSGMQIVKSEFLLFELFLVHKELNKDRYQDFDEFIPFADTLLKDFSDIDLHMVDAKQIFTYLTDEKAISLWDPQNNELSENQKKYLEFYKSLFSYYTKLHERLQNANKAYSAMIYRNVAENIETLVETIHQQNRKTIFAGFCELSKSELTIIETLCKQGIAEFITDGDKFYFDNPDHEAGYLLRKNKESLNFLPKETFEFSENFANQKQCIHFVECQENIIQTEYVGNLISQQIENNKDKNSPLKNTAIVLANEGLLFPLLNTLPQCVENVNVTMGFPFVETPIHNLCLSLFNLYENINNKNQFSTKYIIELLSNAYIEKWLEIKGLHHTLQEYFVENKIFRISKDSLINIFKSKNFECKKITKIFIDEPSSVPSFIELCKLLILNIYNSEENSDRTSLTSAYELFKHFQELQEVYNFVDSLKILKRIYSRISNCIRISFYGKPTDTLQIMGLQETKNMDFKNLYLLSCNEKVIPKGITHNTMIPLSIKKLFGIFTYSDRDATDAYFFYRLLQRAENVYLIYSTETTESDKGEPSRFLAQIEKELIPHYKNIKLEKNIVVTNSAVNTQNEIVATKNEIVMSRLKEIGEEKGFSPSALNTYRNCPLSYYYQYVLKVQSDEDLEENMDASLFGTLVHKILEEDIFKPLIGNKQISKNDLPTGKDLDTIIENRFNTEIFKDGRENRGENHLMLAVAKKEIHNMINCQIETINNNKQVEIVCLEEDICSTITLDSGLNIKIHGIIDRVEKVDNIIRIGDYKTGKVDSKDLCNPKNFTKDTVSSISNNDIKDKWFQVMLYAWLYNKNHPETNYFEAGIYPLRNSSMSFMGLNSNGTVDKNLLCVFEDYLKLLLNNLFNNNICFTQADDKNKCTYCDFRNICLVN